jgi:hypothetical protein
MSRPLVEIEGTKHIIGAWVIVDREVDPRSG